MQTTATPYTVGEACRAIRAGMGDLYRQHLPRPSRQKGFAFLLHPRTVTDITRVYPFLQRCPASLVSRAFSCLWPLTLAPVTGLQDYHTGSTIPGWIIAVPMDAAQLLNQRQTATKRIRQALRLAERRGATLVGLGALLPGLTRYGQRLQGHTRVSLTTGHVLTTWSLGETVMRLLTIFEIAPSQATVAIVGAGGSIGQGTAYTLAKKGVGRLILLNRPRARSVLRALQKPLNHYAPRINIDIAADKTALWGSDIVVTTTNTPEAVLTSQDIAPGTLILNDAQPSDVSPEVEARKDVLVVEGGLVTVPGINTYGVLGLPCQEDVFGCLGETLVLAAHSRQGDFAVGKLDPVLVEQIGSLARAIGVEAAPLQNARRLLTAADLERLATVRRQVRGEPWSCRAAT
jgi:fatty aldehyde-generating acyl-ACP reductase